MHQTQCAIDFYYRHLGQYLAPEVAPALSIAVSLPTRTKRVREAQAKDPSAPLEARRVGTGMPVYYIVTEEHSWFLSNTAPPEHPSLTAVRIDNAEGKTAISGPQYIAHWLYERAPIDRPFLIGSIEKADPIPSLRLSSPPVLATYCTTSSKTGNISLHLQDYRDDINRVKASGVEWTQLKKMLHLMHAVRRAALRGDSRQEEAARKDMRRLRNKHPEALAVIAKLNVMPDSPDEQMLDWFFKNGNHYGRKL